MIEKPSYAELEKKVWELERQALRRKQAENELRESEALYRQLFNIAPAGIYEVDFHTGRIIKANEAVCEYSGYTRDELLAINAVDLLTEESKAKFLDRTSRILNGERVPDTVDYEIIKKDGSMIWLNVSNRYTYAGDNITGSTVVARDITKRKLTEDALIESEAHLRSLRESASEFVVYRLVLDESSSNRLKVAFISDSAREIFGIQDPTNFESWFENMHPDDVARISKANQAAMHTMRFDEEYRIYNHKKGEYRWLHAVSTGIVNEKGWTGNVNGIMIDVTEKHNAFQKLQASEQELEHKTRSLIEMNAALNALIQNMESKESKFQEQVRANMQHLVFPYLEKMRTATPNRIRTSLIDIVETNLKKIDADFSHQLASSLCSLTSTEIKVANLVKLGNTTKEIAATLGIAHKTVASHRERIRKKLGISNRKINLRSHLLAIK